jgi:O-antigen/teichoic acid export membrane protein
LKFTLTPVFSPRLLAALAVVVAGLASRALVDRLLANAGGGERVAAWAQLQSAAELVTGVCAAGVGAGLTVLVAAAPERAPALLRAALALGLGISGVACAGFALAALAFGARLGAAPVAPGLVALAATAGWIAAVASLASSLWAGEHRQGRVLALGCVSGAFSIGAAAIPRDDLTLLVIAHALPGAVLALFLFLRLPFAATAEERAHSFQALRHYVPVGIAIGVASPAGLFAARAILAGALSWHEAGLVQALWRASDWITSLASGVLGLYFLPLLALAAARGALAPSLGHAARAVLPPSALALALLALNQRAVLGFLYGEGFAVPDLAAALFYAGDFVRIASWLPFFALYALRRTRLLVAGEFLSLPLFALLLWLLGERLTLASAGAAWLATYLVYAAFNAFALLRAARSRP